MEQHLEENTWGWRTTVSLDITVYHPTSCSVNDCDAQIWEPSQEREGSMTIILTNYVHKSQKIASKWINDI
jgi:hypothetical protein